MNQLSLIFQESDQKAEKQALVKAKRELKNRQEAQLSKDGKYFEIRLTKGKTSKIDFDDLERVASLRWKAVLSSTKFYAKRTLRVKGRKDKSLSMSRFIMNAPSGICIDHINGDTLDNRKSNLRFCSHIQNHFAARTRKDYFASKYRGVSWSTKDKIWFSQIYYNWTHIFIGHFKSEIEAAIARDFFSHMLHGEFAQINIPDTSCYEDLGM